MASSPSDHPSATVPEVNDDKIEVNDEIEVNDDEVEFNDDVSFDRSKMEKLMNRLRTEKVNLRVHNILIKGNTKTKDSVIEPELEPLKSASTVQEMLVAAQEVQMALKRLNVFDSVKVVIDSGPVELPGTANVVVEVVEAQKVWFGDVGMYAKPEVFPNDCPILNVNNFELEL